LRKGSLSPAAALGVNAEAKPACGGGRRLKPSIQACRNVGNDKGVAAGLLRFSLSGWPPGAPCQTGPLPRRWRMK